jgi:hypothetical protein
MQGNPIGEVQITGWLLPATSWALSASQLITWGVRVGGWTSRSMM